MTPCWVGIVTPENHRSAVFEYTGVVAPWPGDDTDDRGNAVIYFGWPNYVGTARTGFAGSATRIVQPA